MIVGVQIAVVDVAEIIQPILHELEARQADAIEDVDQEEEPAPARLRRLAHLGERAFIRVHVVACRSVTRRCFARDSLITAVSRGFVARDIPVADVWRELGRRFGTSGHVEKASRPPKRE